MYTSKEVDQAHKHATEVIAHLKDKILKDEATDTEIELFSALLKEFL